MAYHYTAVVLVQDLATTQWRQIQKEMFSLCVLHTLPNALLSIYISQFNHNLTAVSWLLACNKIDMSGVVIVSA